MQNDKKIETIVGSKISWLMKWGTLIALLIFLSSYLAMIHYRYSYTKRLNVKIFHTINNNSCFIFTSNDKGLLSEISNTKVVFIINNETKSSNIYNIIKVGQKDSLFYVCCREPINSNYFTQSKDSNVQLLFNVSNRNLFSIIFRDLI